MVYQRCVIVGACKSGTTFKPSVALLKLTFFYLSALRVVMVSAITLVLNHIAFSRPMLGIQSETTHTEG